MGIVIPDGGTIGSASDTDAISIASNGEVTVNQSIKAITIKHTNGTTAITINSDGSLSGKFEGAMKFVSLGKPPVNITSGTEGTDYPASGKTWLCMGMTTGYWNTTTMSVYGMGIPVLILSRNSSGNWLQDDGSYSSTQPTAWVVRDLEPDSASNSVGQSFNQTFSANYGVADLANNTSGTDTAPFAMPTYTIEIDTIG